MLIFDRQLAVHRDRGQKMEDQGDKDCKEMIGKVGPPDPFTGTVPQDFRLLISNLFLLFVKIVCVGVVVDCAHTKYDGKCLTFKNLATKSERSK